MYKNIFVIALLLFCFHANASLFVNCKTNQENVTAEIELKGSKGSVYIKKNGELAYFNYINTSYNDLWSSITVDATLSNGQELNGAKIYFELGRNNSASAIRPYGQLTNKLFPSSEGITVIGMTCDQDYESIKHEVGTND